jgi:hypothetical protein
LDGTYGLDRNYRTYRNNREYWTTGDRTHGNNRDNRTCRSYGSYRCLSNNVGYVDDYKFVECNRCHVYSRNTGNCKYRFGTFLYTSV